jgi:flagellar hook assembly protein FlgD
VVGAEETGREVPHENTVRLTVTPNPSSGQTLIHYSIAQAGKTECRIFDTAGREVRELLSARQAEGNFSVAWDKKDNAGRSAKPGVYFVILETEQKQARVKLVLTE